MSERVLQKFDHSDFVPMTGMENRHVMTILANAWKREFPRVLANQEQRIIDVAPNSKILVECNFTPAARRDEAHGRAIAIIWHGLEGSSRSHYVMGVADKFLANGISTVRVNMRNCGNTMHLTDTLYNAGLSADIAPIAEHFLNDGFDNIFTIGFSLGGNVVLKGAAEYSQTDATWLKGVCAVSPSLDLPTCVAALELWQNRIYELNFLHTLKGKIVQKNKLQPGRYDVATLPKINSVRSFDDTYTAPDGGYLSAADYYSRASALPMIPLIKSPVLVIAAQDDPLVPFISFQSPELQSPNVSLLAPMHGGHAGFVARSAETPPSKSREWIDNLRNDPDELGAPQMVTAADRFWAESSCLKFCARVLAAE
ncbi:MAG: alpha/beta fold hydrolase [Candidatus Melainabacteria bacterium]|nr:alpha/beta fold hydrolase [Candidatus Melainabacteria bacterium]